MEKKKVTITHQLDKTKHTFLVTNPNSLTNEEVRLICKRMNVSALLVNGKLYKK